MIRAEPTSLALERLADREDVEETRSATRTLATMVRRIEAEVEDRGRGQARRHLRLVVAD